RVPSGQGRLEGRLGSRINLAAVLARRPQRLSGDGRNPPLRGNSLGRLVRPTGAASRPSPGFLPSVFTTPIPHRACPIAGSLDGLIPARTTSVKQHTCSDCR